MGVQDSLRFVGVPYSLKGRLIYSLGNFTWGAKFPASAQWNFSSCSRVTAYKSCHSV